MPAGAQAQVVHVRRRVGGPQVPVEVERLGTQWPAQLPREHDLEGVAGRDVLLGPFDTAAEGLLGEVRGPAGRGVGGRTGRQDRAAGEPGARDRLAQPPPHVLDPLDGLLVLLGGRPVQGHQEHALGGVVEDDQVVGGQEGGLGESGRRPRGDGQLLEVAYGFVSEVADDAAVEGRQACYGRLRGGEPGFEGGQRVAVGQVQRDRAVADVRVAGEAAGDGHALQQESGLVGPAEQRERGDRGEGVGQELLAERDDFVGPAQCGGGGPVGHGRGLGRGSSRGRGRGCRLDGGFGEGRHRCPPSEFGHLRYCVGRGCPDRTVAPWPGTHHEFQFPPKDPRAPHRDPADAAHLRRYLPGGQVSGR